MPESNKEINEYIIKLATEWGKNGGAVLLPAEPHCNTAP